MILTVALACAVRHWLSPATIYTLKLVRRGEVVPQGLMARMEDRECKHAMSEDFAVVSQAKLLEGGSPGPGLLTGQVMVVTGPDNRVSGILDERCRLKAPEGPFEPETGKLIVVSPQTPLRSVLRKLDGAGARIAVVARKAADGSQEVLGVITEREVARLSYAAARMAD